MALQDYYNSLPRASYPKTDFIRELAKTCQVAFSTARSWVVGERTPSKEHWSAIEALTGSPATELFPDTTNEGQNNK